MFLVYAVIILCETTKILSEPPMNSPTRHLINIIDNSDDKSKETESGAEKLAATQPSTMEETTDPRKLQTDVGVSDDNDSGEDYVDSEDGESSDNEVCRSVEL